MKKFQSGGIELAYLDQGEGPPVLLVHGFASTATVNWVNPGWVEALVKAGHRVVAMDNRGHGESQKFYDPADYSLHAMKDDLIRLADHLGIERMGVMGYSMGARISSILAAGEPSRVSALVLGGMGITIVEGMEGQDEIAAALLADDASAVTGEKPRMFRRFAERTKSDLKALAACMKAPREPVPAELLRRISIPTLIAYGSNDKIAHAADDLADIIPGSKVLEIMERDHMTVVGDKRLIAGVVDFFARHA
jgi:pimeloyl-ACP methyl ester carboxylesterase